MPGWMVSIGLLFKVVVKIRGSILLGCGLSGQDYSSELSWQALVLSLNPIEGIRL